MRDRKPLRRFQTGMPHGRHNFLSTLYEWVCSLSLFFYRKDMHV